MIPAARPLIGPEERAAVDRVLASGMLAQGAEVAAFEAEFSALVGGRPCVAVNSGTSALHLGLLASGVGPGDEVIVPSFTFAATANAVRLAGATPVFADIEPLSYGLSAAAVAAAVTPRTVGIMPVHAYGQPAAELAGILDVASRHALAVFEDACQSHLASYQGRPVGTFGLFAAFSFYPTKNMTTGEGGMVVLSDESIAHNVRLLRNQGMERQYENEIVGFNNRMTEPAAAMGRVQLQRLPGWTSVRQANAAFLDSALEGVETPRVADGSTHVFHQYTIRAPERDALRAHLTESGVGTGVYYPTPVHRLPSFQQELDLPETERAAREVLSLPVHPALSRTDLEQVAEAVRKGVVR